MMQIVASMQAHPTLWVMGAWYIFSAFVSAMPMPENNAPMFYSWAFGFLHTLSGSIGRVMAMKYSGQALAPVVQVQTIEPTATGGIKATTTVTNPKEESRL